ncbi:hypothetical protein [Polaromonas sp. SM01]|uniref:hypothetical protein n=1 Tax=Polaromonas sp. SM01 TaxID=3085630 RepID=UPI00298137DD|nr:hypothetical protein [Polaromonas sp. SM01]MDW5443254.1 hypothetical protein [Polaromonas sp. SM01]
MDAWDTTTGPLGGVLLRGGADQGLAAAQHLLLTQLDATNLAPWVVGRQGMDEAGPYLQFSLNVIQTAAWAPGQDTLGLSQRLQLDTEHRPSDLTREIVLALLMGPVVVTFPGIAELVSAVRIRHNIVQAARKTTLAFHTSQAERPEDCWTYKEDCGFVILPGVPLLAALAKATQPEVSGALYSFSCYRATEYVMLLGIAEELLHCNPVLFRQLQQLWTERPIMSGEFHEVFLREQGSMAQPLPPRYFVPGDRIWFRNPDAASSEASGYEGSWVIYLGGGLFSNFWKRHKPYTLSDKCLEIYHWRHALYRDAQGHERIDEDKVEALVATTQQDAAEVKRILNLMQRYREPRGVYQDGGCMDTTREFSRWVHPGTADMVLPLQ